jgi:hypothetical protein
VTENVKPPGSTRFSLIQTIANTPCSRLLGSHVHAKLCAFSKDTGFHLVISPHPSFMGYSGFRQKFHENFLYLYCVIVFLASFGSATPMKSTVM